MKENRYSSFFGMLSFLLIGLLLLLEKLLPDGFCLGAAYMISVLLTLYANGRKVTYWAAAIASFSILISEIFIHSSFLDGKILFNHAFAFAGTIVAMFFVLHSKKIAERAHNNNAQANSLFANTTEGIILVNRKGEILLANPFAEKLFGYSKDELTGKNIDILVPDGSRARHHENRAGFHEKPNNRSMGVGRDLYARKKDGSVFPVEISLSHYHNGSEHYVIAFVIDITVRKNNEAVLRKQREELEQVSREIRLLNAELEQKVEDRTTMLRETLAQLENSRNDLETALEKEKELGDLKTRFVSTVSHEFRTPLSAVLSSAALIGKYTKTEDQDKREKHIQRIKDHVTHLNVMLGDLLSLGKLEEGLISYEPDTFFVADFLAELLADLQEVAGNGKRLNSEVKITTPIKTDKRLLRNVLINLISNAIKFSPDESSIEVKVTAEGNEVLFSVKDEGIGISEEDQTHLFERFFRARNAQNIQGTGLGLHIVSKYIELLKGRIALHSELNKGSTFTVFIPKD